MKKEVVCVGCIECGEYVMVLVTGEVHNARCAKCSLKWLGIEGNDIVKKPMGDLE